MDNEQKLQIQARISELPSGGISFKTINGKRYAYYQWSENGKQHARRVHDDEFDELSKAIDERKALQKALKSESVMPQKQTSREPQPATVSSYYSAVKTGTDLESYVSPVRSLVKRSCYSILNDFVYGPDTDRTFIVSGLRRTGKTTLMRQLISEMDKDAFSNTAFIVITPAVDFAKLDSDMKTLLRGGFKYVFIDEASMLDDLAYALKTLSDVYASSGMKIVLSGTESLGLALASDDYLFDRTHVLHTTFIPYYDYSRINPGKSVNDYIRFSGTVGPADAPYLGDVCFTSARNTSEYLENAVAKNIQHSILNYPDEFRFSSLKALCQTTDLTPVVKKLFQRLNEDFILDILNTYGDSSNLAVCFSKFISGSSHDAGLEEELVVCLRYLGLLAEIDVADLKNPGTKKTVTILTQFGLRYSLVESVVKSFMNDPMFRSLSFDERFSVSSRIMSYAKERLISDLVLLETRLAFPEKEVFRIESGHQVFDMAVFVPSLSGCRLYQSVTDPEIGDGKIADISDSALVSDIEHKYGPVLDRAVLYDGNEHTIDNVRYLNLVNYLNGLHIS